MGGVCGRRAGPPAALEPPAAPEPEVDPPATFHDRALQALRTRFGLAWTECGRRKRERQQRPLRSPERLWRLMVEDKLFQRKYHEMGELLKEIKRTKRAERA